MLPVLFITVFMFQAQVERDCYLSFTFWAGKGSSNTRNHLVNFIQIFIKSVYLAYHYKANVKYVKCNEF